MMIMMIIIAITILRIFILAFAEVEGSGGGLKHFRIIITITKGRICICKTIYNITIEVKRNDVK